MDKTVKIQFTPKLDFDSGCETVEVEMLNPADAVDDRLDEIECQINELDSSIGKLTNHADKADYAVAVVSGILTGLLDAMFVKKLELQSIDDIIKSFAKYKGWGEDSNSSYQTFLENKYHTPNDAAYQKGKDIFGKKLNVGGKTHRFDEIAHHPTIEGLFASIIIRFFKVTVYDKNGKKHITTVNTSAKDIATTVIPILITGAVVWLAEMAEKYSNADIDTKLPKILIDIIKMLSTVPMIIEVLKTADNWLGHIMSDVATPSGIPGVFLSFLKHISSSRLLKHTSLPKYVECLYVNHKLSFADELPAIKELLKQSIPAFFNEILVRTIYFIRHLIIEYKLTDELKHINWNNVIPFNNRTIERMITISTGTFTAIDTLDAVVEGTVNSKGNWAEFGRQLVLRLNFVGIGRFTVALGTDAIMGLKKDKKSKERMLLKAESLYLLKTKMYYGDKLMWSACKDTDKSISTLFETMQQLTAQIAGDVGSINDSIKEITSIDGSEIDKNNQGLNKKLLDIL